MKVLSVVLLTACLAVTCDAIQAIAKSDDNVDGDRTIGKVVKLLEEMQSKSKKDAEEERLLFAKFKCYCDQNKEEKTKTVAEMTDKINLLGSKVEDLQGSSGAASAKAAKIKQSMTAK
jgi:uncharacterized coiled-coil protein SlyX